MLYVASIVGDQLLLMSQVQARSHRCRLVARILDCFLTCLQRYELQEVARDFFGTKRGKWYELIEKKKDVRIGYNAWFPILYMLLDAYQCLSMLVTS